MSLGPLPPKDRRVLDRFSEFRRKLFCGCLEWTGATKGGYPYFQYHGKPQPATRLAYRWYRGPIPTGRVIDHLCAHPLCVRSAHLEPITLAENSRRGNRPLSGAPHCREIHTEGIIPVREQPWFMREEPSIPRDGETAGQWVTRVQRTMRALRSHHADVEARMLMRCAKALRRYGIRAHEAVEPKSHLESIMLQMDDMA